MINEISSAAKSMSLYLGAVIYQWYKDGVAISDATNSSFTIPSVVAADAGSYIVVVLNKMGRQISAVATLTVPAAPPSLSGASYSNGTFQMLVSGTAGNYTIQTTTNLATNAAATVWQNLHTTNPTALPFLWTDRDASNSPVRIYRVLLVP